MQNESISNKPQEFKKYIESFIAKQKSSVKDVHKLRVNSRELLSLLNTGEPFAAELKKVIKQSNKIRDMDVFLQEYLGILPKKYLSKLDIKTLMNSIKTKREKKIGELRFYLKSLLIPQSAEFEQKGHIFSVKKRRLEALEQKQLHKYRIYIKKRLYNEKNSAFLDEKRVENLTKVKDLLGDINDNYNALKRLSRLDVKPKLFKKIQKFTERKNLKIFKEFKKIEDKI